MSPQEFELSRRGEKVLEILAAYPDPIDRAIALYLMLGSSERVASQYKRQLNGLSTFGINNLLDCKGIVRQPRSLSHRRIADSIDIVSGIASGNQTIASFLAQFDLTERPRIDSFLRNVYRRMLVPGSRLHATTLRIFPEDDPDVFLVGRDFSPPKIPGLRKIGDFTPPAVFTDPRLSSRERIACVLQREVFSHFAIKGELSAQGPLIRELVPDENGEPLLVHGIADVHVEIFDLKLPRRVVDSGQLNSVYLEQFKFMSEGEIMAQSERFRPGVVDVIKLLRERRTFMGLNVFAESEINLAFLKIASSAYPLPLS